MTDVTVCQKHTIPASTVTVMTELVQIKKSRQHCDSGTYLCLKYLTVVLELIEATVLPLLVSSKVCVKTDGLEFYISSDGNVICQHYVNRFSIQASIISSFVLYKGERKAK